MKLYANVILMTKIVFFSFKHKSLKARREKSHQFMHCRFSDVQERLFIIQICARKCVVSAAVCRN